MRTLLAAICTLAWVVGGGAVSAAPVFRDCATCPEMTTIRAGSFEMGASPTGAGAEHQVFQSETPQHRVTISGAFAVATSAVTRGEYAAFVKATDRADGGNCYVFTGNGFGLDETQHHDWRDPGYVQTDGHPAVCVNWRDASAYAAWLAAKTRRPYRLLSEAEYEYVARAGVSTRRPWGDDANTANACRHGNWADKTAAAVLSRAKPHDVLPCADGFVYTAPVRAFRANRLGVYDIGSNVDEWTEDCAHAGYDGAPRDGSAWTTGGDCTSRMVRGASWVVPPRDFSARQAVRAEARSAEIGFRVALTLGSPSKP